MAYTIEELEKIRDNAINLVRKIKVALQNAKDSGAPQSKLDEIQNDMDRAIIAAGEAQRAIDEFVSAPTANQSTNTEQQNKQYNTSGGADDDNSSSLNIKSNDTFVNTSDLSTSSAQTSTLLDIAQSGTAGRAGNSASSNQTPGARLNNPLGEFSSYTYQLTWYMITPDAYNAFVQTGGTNINALNDRASTGAGAYIIAQSGGINNSTSSRAPGFEFDYYIDDLKINNVISGKASGTSSNLTELSFSIYEPYGLSFLSNLKKAGDNLVAYTQGTPYAALKDSTRQFYVLGIRFQGYDAAGNAIIGKNSENGGGVFEVLYPIKIIDLRFKLDGKLTVYHITASPANMIEAYGLKRGVIDHGASINASTVGDALNDLLSSLNKIQDLRYDKGFIKEKNNYKVKILSEEISAAKIKSKADLDKYKFPMAPAKNVMDINPNLELRSSPDAEKMTVQFKNATPILQAITQIISQSEYLENALKVVVTTANQTNTKTDSPDIETPDSHKVIKWYNLNVRVDNARFDDIVNDFAYDITYVIQPYLVPAMTSIYADKTTKYYGPHKKYYYYYTGKNSEILSYDQVLDNSYFNVVLGLAKKAGAETVNNVPLVNGKKENMPGLNKNNEGMAAQNSPITWLLDPGARAEATIVILGDPDFLMPTEPSSVDKVYSAFYADDNFTINPNGGQVFIEISFSEGVDYNNNVGTMTINDNIVFWEYPPAIQNQIKNGISYLVHTVVSTFKGGKFTQELKCVVNTFSDASTGLEGRENMDSKEVSTNQVQTTGLRTEPSTTNAALQGSSNPLSSSSASDTTLQNFSTGTLLSQTGNSNNPQVVNDDQAGPTTATPQSDGRE